MSQNQYIQTLQRFLQLDTLGRIYRQLGGVGLFDPRHNNQPEALRTVQFVANIIVICLVNLHLFLEMQADSWQDVWYDPGKK